MSKFPVAKTYRGVGIHAYQSTERIARVVRPAIDEVFAMSDVRALIAYAEQVAHPPEARVFASAKARAAHELAADDRTVRPDVDIERLTAVVAGLDREWMSPSHFCSDLEAPDGAARRDEPLEPLAE